MPLRPCLTCGKPTLGRRCPPHEADRERARPPRPTTLAEPEERERRAAVVAAHRAEHGEWCPGWRRPPHQVVPPNKLTADHSTPVAHGGTALAVLCRVCNGAKGASSPFA